MLIVKVIVLGLIFLISGGAVFSRYFQGKIVLELLAGLLASLSVIYLVKDIVHEELRQQPVPPPIEVTPTELPLTSNGTVDFEAVLHPRRDEFETKEEFAVRRGGLLKRFNQAVQQRNPLVQAGVVHLEKPAYDVESGIFRGLRLEWSTWSKTLRMLSLVTIQVPRDEAKSLYESGPDKPVFVTLTNVGHHSNDSLVITKIFLAELGKEIEIVVPKPFRDTLKDGRVGPEMVTIPAGSFRMGDIRGTGESDEQPVHTVTVKSFAMSRHEVTFEEYDYFVEQTGRKKLKDEGWGRGNRPVINISWDDATAYAEWLSGQTGKQYRLPTEAEWEYAARAGTETDYWWGNEIGKNRAACDGCGAEWGWDAKKMTAPVCSFVYNPFGLCDTVGNVWEWTCSEYEGKYNGKELECIGKNRVNEGSLYVIRGGAWLYLPRGVRASYRNWNSRVARFLNVGFRLVRM